MKEVKEIKILYEDESEKVITRGVCFSVIENGDTVSVTLDAISGGSEDVYAVLGILSQLAEEMGIDESFRKMIINKKENENELL